LLMADLEKNKPYIIVDTAVKNIRQFGKYQISNYSNLENFIENNYTIDKSSKQQNIYVLKSSN